MGNKEVEPDQRYREDWPLLRQTLSLRDLVDSVMLAEMAGMDDLSLRNHINTSVEGRNLRHYAPIPVVRAESRKPMFLASEAEEFARRWEGVRSFRSRRRI
ncbi:MAG: hypothetical protein DRI46_12030 [Chloroflexi bacterium]|nr:MAG: hypothetical protein DRI46_12030 [Chloroflexota bacterium]